MARPKPELVLSDDDRQALTRWANRPRVPSGWPSARIVLACADEPSNKAVAERLGVCAATVGTWRNRFVAQRLEGLTEEPRPGAPRAVTDDVVERVVTRTLETKPALLHNSQELGKRTGHAAKSIQQELGNNCDHNSVRHR